MWIQRLKRQQNNCIFYVQKEKCFQYSCRRNIYIYIYKNSWWIGMVSVSVAVRKCNWKINSQKQAFRNYGVITRLPCMYSIQEIWFLFFFYFFACVCVCVNIRKNCLLCAVNRQSCIYSFWAIWCVLFFFLCMWIWWQNW